MKRPEWNYAETLALLGNERGVSAHIEAWGFDAPPLTTIKGWKQRNSVPGRWAPLIAMIAMREGIIANLNSLVKAKE